MNCVELIELRREVACAFDLWRARLLSAADLAKLAKSMGLGWFTKEDIIGLWGIGLLRADLVISPTEIASPTLRPLGTSLAEPPHSYCDTRTIEHRLEGYGSALCEDRTDAAALIPQFHPHRLFVLFHVQRTLQIETSSTQYLHYEGGVQKVVDRRLGSLKRWTSSVEFGQRFDYWNSVSETASVAEPFIFDVVHQGATPSTIPFASQSPLEQRVRELLIRFGKQGIHQMREALALNANALDGNHSVHVLLRLMRPKERSKINGRIGCAMHFLGMAETIRRVAEGAFEEALPEEDELGPGQWFPGARKRLYGSERVFDASTRDLRDYLTQLGLDFGVKVRCYVEGATEYGALDHAVGSLGHVQLVDLKGRVVERGGKGLAFAESIRADRKLGVFSVVLLDGDVDENTRVLRRAAEQDCIAGSFFVFTPDMECGNFSATELIGIAVELSHLCSTEPEAATRERMKMLEQASTIRSNRDLLNLLATHGISDVRKDEQWGQALMKHAIAQPMFGGDDPRAGAKRPLVEAVELILRIEAVGFQRSLDRERVDPATGRPVRRSSSEC